MPTFTHLTPRAVRGVALASLQDDGVVLQHGAKSAHVTGITVSGNEARAGDVFAALPGRHTHGAQHWLQATAAGAVAVLTDAAGEHLLANTRVPVLIADNPREALGRVAARIYGTDHNHPRLFGVTGTNGKTTTVHLLDAILEQVGIRAGHSSTADRRSGPTTVASRLTSPEASELHALLARMNEDGVAAAALEVSAQALTRNRVDGITFDVAGFTNLSHDHLDDYATMDEYLRAKLRLFTPNHASAGIVSLDSPAGSIVQNKSNIPTDTITSIGNPGADWSVRVLDVTPTSTAFALRGPLRQTLTSSIPLVGRHMAADAGLAIAMLTRSGIPFEQLTTALHDGIIVTVPGRTELLSGPSGPRVYTDFSHTPDSIAKTLEALRVITTGQLIVIVGADGDKDSTKRTPMGEAAARSADTVIVTDHHPRFEDPATIRHAILQGAHNIRQNRVYEIPDPAAAIRTAIGLATENDTILWVGPGHTDYRVVRDQDIPYSPRNDARHVLAEHGWPTTPTSAS